MPQGEIAGGMLEMTFYSGRSDITYQVYASDDVTTWPPDGVALSAPDINGYRTASVPAYTPAGFIKLTIEERQ